MFVENENTTRKNPFRKIYDNPDYKLCKKRKFPYIVDVELTNQCNLSCIFCGQQTMKRPKGYIDADLYKKIVNECYAYDTPIRLIRWGEPFLHPKILTFIEYTKELGIPLHITNNGLALTKSHMESLVYNEVDSIIFSFQGATKEQYEIMRNNNRYEELVGNIEKLIEIRAENAKPFIHISTTITDETKQEVDDFVNHWSHIVDSVGVGRTDLSRLDINRIKNKEVREKLTKVRDK